MVSNLLTEGQGMRGFTAADEVAWVSQTIGRKVDVVIANQGQPSQDRSIATPPSTSIRCRSAT